MSDPHLIKTAFIEQVASDIKRAGGKPYLVGGSVRDILINGKRFVPKDIDMEVFGMTRNQLANILKPYKPSYVGKSFGVFKLQKWNIDISLPRREYKIGDGHTDFEVEVDPRMSIEEAASRRDFTMNAIYMSLDDGGYIKDPFNGASDINSRMIRHTSDRFVEDPLRVLRAMQFAARLGFNMAPETIELCKTLSINGISKERIFEEFSKLILQGSEIGKGLKVLRDTEWVKFFPELELLIGNEQSPTWHAEGDVWNHTLMCMNEFAVESRNNEFDSSVRPDEDENLIVGLAVLCHDLGKPHATTLVDGKIHHYGHEVMGEEPTRSFLERITDRKDLIEDVVTLVVNHHRPAQLWPTGSSRTIRRLANDVGRIDRLARVTYADYAGRLPKDNRGMQIVDWLTGKAASMNLESKRPDPIIMGRHLIQLGLKPSKDFGYILKGCYEAQLNEEFTTEAGGMVWLKNLLNEWSR